MIKKNDIVRLEIVNVTLEGEGVGRHENMAVFVPHAACGDVIECRIVKVLKNRAYGIIGEITDPSPDREDRGCGVKKTCGGCVFRDISYKAELAAKEAAVKAAFSRIGGFDLRDGGNNEGVFLPILGCEFTDRYRNKAQYPVAADKSGRAVCGFYAKRSHRIVPCGDCLLQPKTFGEITGEIIAFVNAEKIPPYNEETRAGFLRHIYLRRGHYSREIMVCLAVTEEKKYRDKLDVLARRLVKKFPAVKSVLLNINRKKTNVILGDRYVTLFGEGFISDTMCGNKISLSPEAFYQVNTLQAERLYEIAGDFGEAAVKEVGGDAHILDLYCGAGTIGLYLAKRFGCPVTGAEIVPGAVENAKKNARDNGIENIYFICADAKDAARQFADSGRTPALIVTDPPRKGCDEQTLKSIVDMQPKSVVMVSCDPATAARDCRFLADSGYTLKNLRAVDMFPGTGHAECATVMVKAGI
ncbi:MAG: 23S rRNA (uracil(1939)-C(5))-methyltransferase RlmD [Ruminococcus sp.]|nr:23S rRNA (uracil(1939)-C(5))-methyltransferase RlmD [Ruminococcus sp.]